MDGSSAGMASGAAIGTPDKGEFLAPFPTMFSISASLIFHGQSFRHRPISIPSGPESQKTEIGTWNSKRPHFLKVRIKLSKNQPIKSFRGIRGANHNTRIRNISSGPPIGVNPIWIIAVIPSKEKREQRIVILIHDHGKPQLMQISFALGGSGFFTSLAQSRQEHGHKDGNNGNDDEKLD